MFNFFQLTAEEQWISLSGTQYQYILYISIQWILNTIFSHFSVVFYSHFFFFFTFPHESDSGGLLVEEYVYKLHAVTLLFHLFSLEIYSIHACGSQWIGIGKNGRMLVSRISHVRSNVFFSQDKKQFYLLDYKLPALACKCMCTM